MVARILLGRIRMVNIRINSGMTRWSVTQWATQARATGSLGTTGLIPPQLDIEEVSELCPTTISGFQAGSLKTESRRNELSVKQLELVPAPGP